MSSLIERKRVAGTIWLTAVALFMIASAASADTLLMPTRDFVMGTSEVVWGATTQPNGTAFLIDYGDGSTSAGVDCGAETFADRSYIACQHTYPISGTFTVRLCVGAGAVIPGCPGELASVVVRVFNSATLTASELRGLNINRTIQDGLRYLWTVQAARNTNFPLSTAPTNPQQLTNWGAPWNTSLVVLAFENQGYRLPNDDSAPTGIYERFIVQRGLNYIMNTVVQVTLDTQHAGVDNPCVGVPAPACTGLEDTTSGNPGYSNAITSLALAGAPPSRHAIAGLGGVAFAGNNAGFVAGRTHSEILQRIMNTTYWGQNDGPNLPTCNGRGGWIYQLSDDACQQSDGSTDGWDLLALFDAGAAGAVVPQFVKDEYTNFAIPLGQNTDGTFDYRSDNNPAVDNLPNFARVGIGLQGLRLANAPASDPRVIAGLNALNSRWVSSTAPGEYLATCFNNTTLQNKGCAYGMFNAFKALRLYGIASLPAAPDWYGEYEDYLVANQTAPQTVAGGGWDGGTGRSGGAVQQMQFSGPGGVQNDADAAIAELILSPVALVAPDPTLFATVGLSPATDTNPVGTDHTVTAFAQSANNQPVPGATIGFTVLAGPNAGASGTCVPAGCVTPANGMVSFTYHDTNGAGHDTIQANIGALLSNIVDKFWVVPTIKCDTDGDNDVDLVDLLNIRNANGQIASGPTDPRDGNSDGVINVLDARYCQLRLTR